MIQDDDCPDPCSPPARTTGGSADVVILAASGRVPDDNADPNLADDSDAGEAAAAVPAPVPAPAASAAAALAVAATAAQSAAAAAGISAGSEAVAARPAAAATATAPDDAAAAATSAAAAAQKAAAAAPGVAAAPGGIGLDGPANTAELSGAASARADPPATGAGGCGDGGGTGGRRAAAVVPPGGGIDASPGKPHCRRRSAAAEDQANFTSGVGSGGAPTSAPAGGTGTVAEAAETRTEATTPRKGAGREATASDTAVAGARVEVIMVPCGGINLVWPAKSLLRTPHVLVPLPSPVPCPLPRSLSIFARSFFLNPPHKRYSPWCCCCSPVYSLARVRGQALRDRNAKAYAMRGRVRDGLLDWPDTRCCTPWGARSNTVVAAARAPCRQLPPACLAGKHNLWESK